MEPSALRAINYLFSLPGNSPEMAAFHNILDFANTAMTNSSNTSENLIEILRQYADRIALLRTDQAEVEDPILDALITLLSGRDSAIPPLIQKLDDYNGRYLAATVLGWFGADAIGAVPALVDLVSSNSGAAGAAKQALLRIGSGEAALLSALQASLDEGDDFQFLQLSDMLSAGGYDSGPTFATILRQAAEHSDPELRADVAGAIGQLRPVTRQQFLPVLENLKADPVSYVREAALKASAEI